jgi:plastocyanin
MAGVSGLALVPIAGRPQTPPRGTPAAHVVEIRNHRFLINGKPGPLRIRGGDRVVWVNKDSVAHTATSDPGSSFAFDTKRILPGTKSPVVTFRPGDYTVNYHCTYHAAMKGRILVGKTGGIDPLSGQLGPKSLHPPILKPPLFNADPAQRGEWAPLQKWPIVAIHVHVLPTGKVLLWPRSEKDGKPKPAQVSYARLWDPATGSFSTPPRLPYNPFCSGHTFLGDGRLLVVGGHIQDGHGEPHASIYNPFTNNWQRLPDMNDGRWYPTAVTLASGEGLVLAGDTKNQAPGGNQLPQVLQGRGTWRNLTGARASMPLYPWLHLAPNGKVFASGPQMQSKYLDTAGAGRWTAVADRTLGQRDAGTSVMYDTGKVLVLGGGVPPTSMGEVIDLNAPRPTWRRLASKMQFGRELLNATLLPDGTVLVTGGTSQHWNRANGSVVATDLWDPKTERFTALATQADTRMYHSTAFLLPDGRVVSAGGGEPHGDDEQNDHPTAQIFSPPYLFRGPRPVIDSAPTTVRYGATFAVGVKSPKNIRTVTWVRLSSVTHSFNSNQRINFLRFTQTASGLQVTAPASASLCPPGHYMLFVLSDHGVPSVARIIKIG